MDDLQYYTWRKLYSYYKTYCFKPYYKWMTFNTKDEDTGNINDINIVLNLIING